MRTVARVLAAGTTSFLLVGLVPASALAGPPPAHVVTTSPEPDTRVPGPLSTISVTFDENTAGTLSVTPPGTAGDFHCTPGAPSNPPTPTVVSCVPDKTGGLLDGTYSVHVVASVASSPTPTPIDYTFSFILDTTAPPAPTGLALSPSPYNKASADAATPVTVSGTSESATDTVAITLTSSGASATSYTKNVAATTAGAFSTTFDPTNYPLVDGTLTATARATDNLGNVSPPGATGLATATALKDTVAPTAPTGVTINPAPYTKADLDTPRPISVSGTAAAPGESVTVTLSSAGGGSPATATTTAIAGSGAFGVSFAAGPFPDGTLTATVRSTDAAGNASAATTRTTTRDTVLPWDAVTVPYTTATAAGSQRSQTSGGSTNGFSVVADDTLGSPSTIVLKDASNRGIAGTSSVVGSSVSVVPDAPLAEGSYTATVTLVDVVGNVLAPFTRSFTIDNTIPSPGPIFTSVPVINIGNAGTYTVAGRGEPGATVTVNLTDTARNVVTDTALVVSAGTWSVTKPVGSLVDGNVGVTASQADAAGNTSVLSSAGTTKDTVAPRVSQQTFSQERYAGANPLLVTVTGKVDSGVTTVWEAVKSVTVTVTDGAGHSAAGVDSVVGTDGVFSADVNATALVDGTITAHVVATDSADNLSVEQTHSAIKDTGAPTMPTVTVTDPVNSASELLVVAAGTSEAASTVTVTIDDANNAGSAPVQRTATAADGTFSVSPVMDLHLLSDGVLTVTARARDEAGNLGAIRTITVTKDTQGPAKPAVTTFPTYVNAANVAAVPVTGTAESGAAVVLLVTDSGSGSVTRTVPATSGAFSTTLDLSSLAQGALRLTATPTDTRGNPGNPDTKLSTKDTVAPGTAAELSASPSPYDLAQATANATLAVTGKDAVADRSASTLRADITLTDTSGSTAPVTELGVPVTVTTGVFSFAFTKAQVLSQADGTLTVSVVLHDLAGNRSSARQTTLVKDVTELAVMSTTPAAAAASSQPIADVVIATNEALVTGTSPGTSPYSRISVTNGLDNQVLGSIVFLAGDKGMTFTPSSPFTEAGSPYVVTLHAADANDTFDTVDQVTTFSVDMTAPVAPSFTSVTNPVKASNKDAVSVTGNAGEQGAKVTVTVTGVSGSPRVYEATEAERSAANGSYTLQINVSNLPDGALRVSSAFSTDRAGNVGPVSTATLTTTKDATLPVVSSLAATASDFSHPSSSVTGQVSEAVAGSTVSLSATDGTHVVTGSATVLSNRTFATTLGLTSMNAGPVTVTVTALDAVGNTGTASVVTARDTATPPTAAPTGPGALASDRAATVSFTPVTNTTPSNGGASITSYTVVITNTVTSATSTFLASTSPVRVTGLTNGALYTFKVMANNRAGSGPVSSASTAVKPMGSSSLTLGALPTKVVKGATIKLAGTLTRTDTSVAPAQLLIRVRTDSGTVATLARVAVSSTGTFAYSYKPSFNRFYSVIYPGDAKGTSSASTARRVLVAAKVTASAPRGSRTVNQVITGGVSPNKKDKTVTLYRVTSSGARVKLATTTLSSTSTYRFSVRLPAGYTTLMVAIGTTPNNASGFVRFRAYRT